MTVYFFTLCIRLSELDVANKDEIDLVFCSLRISSIPDFSCLGPLSCFTFCVPINVDILTSLERKQRDLPGLWDPLVRHRNLFPRPAGPDVLYV